MCVRLCGVSDGVLLISKSSLGQRSGRTARINQSKSIRRCVWNRWVRFNGGSSDSHNVNARSVVLCQIFGWIEWIREGTTSPSLSEKSTSWCKVAAANIWCCTILSGYTVARIGNLAKGWSYCERVEGIGDGAACVLVSCRTILSSWREYWIYAWVKESDHTRSCHTCDGWVIIWGVAS